jgi:DNA polymerase I-like protein with 3'-5' exonuclease and polymerase domains
MSSKNYDLVRSLDELGDFFTKMIDEGKPVGFDIETGYHGPPVKKGAVRTETNLIAGFSFTNSKQWARYAALNHDLSENLDNYGAAKLLWPLMNSGLIVAHNAGFELRNLARFFRDLLSNDPIFGEAVRKARGYFKVRSDTWVESFLVGEEKSHALKPLVLSLFDHKMIQIEELFTELPANRMNTMRFNELELTPKVVEYACEDSLWCLEVHNKYYPQVSGMFLYKVDMEIIYVLCDMEDFGLKFDWELFRETREKAEVFVELLNAEIQEDLTEMAGEPININLASSPQLGGVLYGKLGMSTTRMTKGSRDTKDPKMSTDAIALEALSRQYPVVKKIHDWKGIQKLLTSYLKKYEKEYGYAPDGMVHPGLNQAFVVTGRFSASDPNYQQAPKDGIEEFLDSQGNLNRKSGEKTGRTFSHWYELRSGETFKFNFRDAIVAPDDYYILGFDLSQAELRAIAGEAGEQALLDAFEQGIDVHSATAALMLGKDISEVTKEDRAIGKTCNFALLYGMGAKSLADRLAISIPEAEQLFRAYFSAYPNIKVWVDKQIEFGRKNHYVLTRFGRRCPIWAYESDKHWIRSGGDRNSFNYPIQGAATGDYVRIAMVRAHKAIAQAGLSDKIRLVMNVHDALEFYVHRSVDLKVAVDLIRPQVVFPIDGWPSMVADWHIGQKWGSVKDIILKDDGSIWVKKGEMLIPPSEELSEGSSFAVEASAEEYPAQLPEEEVELSEDSSGRLVVELSQLPEAASYKSFVSLLKSRPGHNKITIKTPEGDVDLPITTSVGVEEQPKISMLLGGARVYFAEEEIDPMSVLAGMSL